MLVTVLATAAMTPVLSVSGSTLSWTAVGAGAYKLSAKAPGAPVVNTTVYGTKYTPAPSPGQTVTFKIKAPGESGWSNKVTITYPAAEKLEEKPVEEEHKAQPAKFLAGVNGGTETADLTAATTLHAKLVRLHLAAPEQGASWLDEWDKRYRERGVQVLPLVTFNGRILTAAEAKALVGLDRLPGVTDVELGNETSYSYQYKDNFAATSYRERARLYAVRVKETAEVLNPHGIGVLAQAEDGGSGSSNWVKEMFAAVPNLTRYVAGWTIHPYSNQRSPSEPDTSGVPKMERMVANLAEQGDTTTPIDITEWGESSDEGQTLDNGTHLTYSEAAQIVETTVPKLIAAAKRHPIASFLVYKDRDLKAPKSSSEHEAFYGALTNAGSAKGAYTTAIQKLMTAAE